MAETADLMPARVRPCPRSRVRGLRHRFGDNVAVDGIDLPSSRARSSGCSGPTVPARRRRSGCVNTLLPVQEGAVEVLGYDVAPLADGRAPPARLRAPAALDRGGADRARERHLVRAALRRAPRRAQGAGGRRARGDGARRRRRPSGRDLLGRHDPPARAGPGARQPARSCSCSTSRRWASTRSRATASGSGSRRCGTPPG